MPKSEKKSATDKILSFVVTLIQRNKDTIMKGFNDALHLKRTVRRYAVLMIASLISIIIILDGLGIYISYLYPNISPGLVHIAIGALLLLSALVYNGISK